jgi:energy-coupling factor transport system substrate-specific component
MGGDGGVILLLISAVVGVALFLWPFVGLGLPAATPALAIGLGTAVGLLAVEVGTRRMDARQLALLAALSALDAGLRAALVTGIGGFSPIFLLVLCGGYALGPEFGFLLGACSLLVSALLTGGLGPWVPYQLFAVGWVGAVAGFVGMRRAGRRPSRSDVLLLAGIGVVTGFGFGAVMDIWNWTFYYSSPQIGWSSHLAPLTAVEHFGKYYLVTSVEYDAFRAGGNALMVAIFGLPVLAALHRLSRRFRSEWPGGTYGRAAGLLPILGSAQAPDHIASGHLVVPALLAPVNRSPNKTQGTGGEIERVPHQADEATAET